MGKRLEHTLSFWNRLVVACRKESVEIESETVKIENRENGESKVCVSKKEMRWREKICGSHNTCILQRKSLRTSLVRLN